MRAAAEESAFLVPSVAQLQSQYSSLGCPVRIFHGTDDQVTEPEQARRLHEALRRSLLDFVEDAGHMVTNADTRGIAHAVVTVAGAAAP